MNRMRSQLLTVLVVAGAVAAPAAAQATTVSFDGVDVHVDGGAGEANRLVVSMSDDGTTLDVSETGAGMTAGAGCTAGLDEGTAECPMPPGRVLVAAGDGNDAVTALQLSSTHWADGQVRADLGPGDDTFKGGNARDVAQGGAGRDELRGLGGDDELDGGEGDDTLVGGAGRDTLLAGAGDDALDGDEYEQPAADVLDGGPGRDTVLGWAIPDEDRHAPASLTLDGVANDGRPGEGDDVREVEAITSHVSGTFAFGDAADVVEVWSNLDGGASTVTTAGGDDRITTGSNAETIDAGPGDDVIDAGFGDDTITAGPGRDRVSADQSSENCGLFTSCRMPSGNDVVDVRDGEADSVTCGFGTDTVRADPIDTIADDCENVERGGGPQPGPGPVAVTGGACLVPKLRGATVKVARRRLAAAGCRATVRYRSHRRAARVTKVSHRAGKRLARGARVTITVR